MSDTQEQSEIAARTHAKLNLIDAGLDRVQRGIGSLREYRTRPIADVVTGNLDVRAAAARLPNELARKESPDLQTPQGEDDQIANDQPLDAPEALA